ncbi:YqhR family membrane protein [Peribacillus muralis]|uniref:YqhR family membrane protein n=1 Tax=Peribacillus muralis TaxID=264697 RepID=UPI00070BCD81|nr:YqhR family membrane protein [Peribacillus muralis]MCK1991470.1 YqhR family membrane protein [Peribacillus muralis]MCK2012029.1 YqhR family membrane protein [Peribacillus muralis]
MSANEHGQNQQENQSVLIYNALIIGFVGGAAASLAGMIAHYVNFMDFSPRFILTSWSNMKWIDHWLGVLMTVILFGILSVVIALLYYALFKRVKSMFSGIIFGVVCWALLIFVLKPMFSDLPAFSKMSTNTIITSVCIFILYGLFLGYSISYDHQEYIREKNKAQKQQES